MTRRILIAALLLSLVNTAGAVRVLKQLERPVELTVSQLTLPTSASGTLSFRECGDCRISTHRVDEATKYFVNDGELALVDFSRVIEDIRAVPSRAETTNAAVFLDVDSERVTRVLVKVRNP